MKYELKEYEIWADGFLVQGMEGIPQEPQLVGKSTGRSFQDACFRYYLKQELENRLNADENDNYYDTKEFNYDRYGNTYWGLKLAESFEELASQRK